MSTSSTQTQTQSRPQNRGRSSSLSTTSLYYNTPAISAAFQAAASSSSPPLSSGPMPILVPSSPPTSNAGLSSSPTSASSTSSIATPPSSSPTSFFNSYYGIPLSKSVSAVPGGGGGERVGIMEEEDDEVDDVFAKGERWGWPQGGQHRRRASMGPTTPGWGATLGRVNSAGASFGGTTAAATNGGTGGGNDGWGLFRRLSLGGNGRPKPPSPPSSSLGIAPSQLSSSTPASATHERAASMPSPVIMEEPTRGRKVNVGGVGGNGVKEVKAKRKISPMGERMLRGGLDH